MRVANIAAYLCVAGMLSGCGMAGGIAHMQMFQSARPGSTVRFVSANADTVLLDFRPVNQAEQSAADDVATQECRQFGRGSAGLESLNVRGEGLYRATYLCGK